MPAWPAAVAFLRCPILVPIISRPGSPGRTESYCLPIILLLMQKTLLLFWFTWLSLMAGGLAAQPVTGSLAGQDLSLCGANAPLTFSYTNNVNTPLTGVSIQLVLPACVRYVQGSMVGASMTVTGVNATTNTISITAPTLAVGATASFTIQVNAQCGSQCGTDWSATATLASSGGPATITSPLYNLQSPALSQTVSPTNQTASVGASFQRCVTVTNGGLGALTSFTVVVNSVPSSLSNTLFMASGNPIAAVTSGNNQTLTIGASQIQAVGDGDALFEQNEILVICYQVDVVDCIDSTSSTITTTWGCGGQTCGSTTESASVVVSPGAPSLVATHQYTPTYCHGGGNANTLSITLANNGTGPARDVMVNVRQSSSPTAPPSANMMSSLDPGTVRLVDALGDTVVVVPESLAVGTPPSFMSPCFPTNQSTTGIWVRIPSIAAGSNVKLVVDQKTCCKSWCEGSMMGGLIYQVDYMNQCHKATYAINPVAASALGISRIVSIARNGPTDLVGATPGNYELVHSDFRLLPSLPGARLEVALTIPAGLTVDPNTIRFVYPSGTVAFTPSATPTMVNPTTMHALFALPPPPVPTVYQLEKIELRFSLIADCSTGPCSSGPKAVSYQIYQVPDTSCACRVLIACHNFSVTTHCGICPGTCPDGGMVFTGFDVYRTSYGQNDTPDNGAPNPGPLTPLVRSQYVMFGDTFETKFKGVVATTVANPAWQRGFASSIITNGNCLTSLSYHVRIKDQGSGSVYQGTLLGVGQDSIPPYTFNYTLDVLNLQTALGLPIGFAYQNGDSVEVTARYRVSDNFPGMSTQNISNTFALQDTSGSLVADCDTFSGTVTLVGYYYTSAAQEVYNATGCADVQVTENCYLSIGPCCNNYAGGNVFRNEFRHFGVPKQCTVTLPVGYSFVPGTASFRHYRTIGTNGASSTIVAPITPLPGPGNPIVFDLDTLFPSPIPLGDEGHYGTLTLSLRPSCAVAPLISQVINYNWEFAPVPQLTGPNSEPPFKSANDIIRHRPPQLWIPPIPTVSGTASTVTWTVPVSNQSNVANSTNTWMALVSPTGLVQPTSVQVAGGPAITSVGGIYQLGTLPFNSTRSYQITATYGNCNLDSLRVLIGWDCNGYPSSLAANPCIATSAKLEVQPAPTALQATLTATPATIGICDSFTVEAVVVATQPGDVLNIGLQVSLPLTNGLSYLPGSSSLLYPVSGSYVPLGNPTISGNQLIWQSSLVDLPDTLPGVTQIGPNTFRIRFRLRSNCNMISGDQLRMDVLGTRTCGAALPPFPVLSNPITITGATPAYTTQITTTVTDVNVCTRVKRLTIRMRKIGTAWVAAGDAIAVNLPAGNAYLGGFTATTNPPGTTTPTILTGPGGNRLTWPIATSLANGDSMVFSFNVTAPCGMSLVTVQSLNAATLSCGVTTCSTFVQAGGALATYTVALPNLGLNITSATYQFVTNAATIRYHVNVQNTGTPVAAGIPIVLQTYCDTDGSGSWSAGDALYNSQTYTGGLGSGSFYILSDTFNMSHLACPAGRSLFFVVQANPATGLCLCDTAVSAFAPPLPVEWISISGEALASTNAVHWEATLLPGHDHFVLERALDNGWEDISAPIYGRQASYTAHDLAPPLTGRYRVRSHDQNGETDHSPVVEILRQGDGTRIQLYPNPTDGVATLEVHCPACQVDGDVQAALSDLSGKVLKQMDAVLEQGTCAIPVNLRPLPAGTYLLRVWGPGMQSQVLRVLRQ